MIKRHMNTKKKYKIELLQILRSPRKKNLHIELWSPFQYNCSLIHPEKKIHVTNYGEMSTTSVYEQDQKSEYY